MDTQLESENWIISMEKWHIFNVTKVHIFGVRNDVRKKTSRQSYSRFEQLFSVNRASLPSFQPTCIHCQSEGEGAGGIYCWLCTAFYFYFLIVESRGKKISSLIHVCWCFLLSPPPYAFSALLYAPKKWPFHGLYHLCSVTWWFLLVSPLEAWWKQREIWLVLLILSALAPRLSGKGYIPPCLQRL